MALITALLIQHANAEKHSGLYTMITSVCIQQGDDAIAKLIKQGTLDDKYENMDCEQVLKDLKR